MTIQVTFIGSTIEIENGKLTTASLINMEQMEKAYGQRFLEELKVLYRRCYKELKDYPISELLKDILSLRENAKIKAYEIKKKKEAQSLLDDKKAKKKLKDEADLRAKRAKERKEGKNNQ